jgi:hypothetical protein
MKLQKGSYNGLVFVVLLLGFGILTALSWFLAYGHGEGCDSTICIAGYYSFYLFRFPTHNIIFLKEGLVKDLFIPGLIVNVFFYSSLITFIVARSRGGRKVNM